MLAAEPRQPLFGLGPSTRDQRQFAADGEAPAIITPERSVSYRTLWADASRMATEIGGDRRLVFLEASNTVDAIVAYVACLWGGHPVFLCSSQDRSKVEKLAELYRPNVMFRATDGATTMHRIHDGQPALHPDLAVLLSTSGSTGSPKLVKLSGRNLRANALSIAEYLRLEQGERAMLALKFNYSYGMSVVNSHLLCGGAIVLTEDSVVDDRFWDTFRRCRATSLAGVPYTFETLHRNEELRFQTEHLRYMTQAGGRLPPELVRHFARLSSATGWRFYVMYGQTEAAPRMAYLPPERALEYPTCIGVPVPGGRISVLDDDGREISGTDIPGELAYSGPNVMLGYARTLADLATDDTPARLLTGDIACWNEAGLLYITGRRSRFVKPFGVRVNLDDIEAQCREMVPSIICVGVQERIVLAVRRDEVPPDLGELVQKLAERYGLPTKTFQTVVFDQDVPRLANGKANFEAIERIAADVGASDNATPSLLERAVEAFKILVSPAYRKRLQSELMSLLGVREAGVSGVAGIYASLLPDQAVSHDSTFTGLAGDSLTYVEASLALEEYLGMLPKDWERLTVTELEQMRAAG